MIYGIGVDILEVGRIEKLISNTPRFKQRVFTQHEIDYCELKKNRAQNYAARFAAKEAFLKAIGTGWKRGVAFKEIEIVNNKQGKPELVLYGKSKEFAEQFGLKNIQVSVSHIKDLAVAIVIAEK
jgi:holo-[acyl-carrier protein] synthase